MHDDPHEEQAKSLQRPEEGFSYVYVARPYAQQRSVATEVYVDGKHVTTLGPMTFARLKVKNGRHLIRISTAGVGDKSVEARIESNVYLQYQLIEQFFSVKSQLETPSPEKAFQMIDPLDLVLSD